MLRKVRDLRDLVNYAAAQYGDGAAYLYKEKLGGEYLPISFRQFREDVYSLGTALLAAGYKGKHIAVIGESRYEWIVTYFAVACGLGVIVPLDKELPVQEVSALAGRADISAIVYSAKVGAKVREALQGMDNIQLICGRLRTVLVQRSKRKVQILRGHNGILTQAITLGSRSADLYGSIHGIFHRESGQVAEDTVHRSLRSLPAKHAHQYDDGKDHHHNGKHKAVSLRRNQHAEQAPLGLVLAGR